MVSDVQKTETRKKLKNVFSKLCEVWDQIDTFLINNI